MNWDTHKSTGSEVVNIVVTAAPCQGSTSRELRNKLPPITLYRNWGGWDCREAKAAHDWSQPGLQLELSSGENALCSRSWGMEDGRWRGLKIEACTIPGGDGYLPSADSQEL